MAIPQFSWPAIRNEVEKAIREGKVWRLPALKSQLIEQRETKSDRDTRNEMFRLIGRIKKEIPRLNLVRARKIVDDARNCLVEAEDRLLCPLLLTSTFSRRCFREKLSYPDLPSFTVFWVHRMVDCALYKLRDLDEPHFTEARQEFSEAIEAVQATADDLTTTTTLQLVQHNLSTAEKAATEKRRQRDLAERLLVARLQAEDQERRRIREAEQQHQSQEAAAQIEQHKLLFDRYMSVGDTNGAEHTLNMLKSVDASCRAIAFSPQDPDMALRHMSDQIRSAEFTANGGKKKIRVLA